MRVKFYSGSDWSCGKSLERAEEILKEHSEDREIQDINDMIELYNVYLFFENKIYLDKWLPEEVQKYNITAKLFLKKVAVFIKGLSDVTFKSQYEQVEIRYRDCFWSIVDRFKVYKNISSRVLIETVSGSKTYLWHILKRKGIVENHGHAIRVYMLENPITAELILSKYKATGENDKNLYLPKELDHLDIQNIIDDYIDCIEPEPNLNYLRMLSSARSVKGKINFSPEILLKAKRKVEELGEKYFEKKSGITFGLSVEFSEDQSEAVVSKQVGTSMSISYSEKWIEENLDFPTLLNNFIYTFEFTDLHMRLLLVSSKHNISIFENLATMYSDRAYRTGVVFNLINKLAIIKMRGYYDQLLRYNVRMEEIVEWFFADYLLEEFSAKNFRVIMPSQHSTFHEKCTCIMPDLESVLNQFTLFVENDEIDFELLGVSSKPLTYDDIPSLIKRKYVYGANSEYEKVTYLLFSDQSFISFDAESGKPYESFYELLLENKKRVKDYSGVYYNDIKWLLDNGYLAYDEEEFLSFSDRNLIEILKDLYLNEVTCYWKNSIEKRIIIDRLEEKGLLRFGETLFTEPEQKYISFFLNRAKYDNGLELRNKYHHSQPEREHKNDYMVFLRIFILTVIKINDEFCTFDILKNEMKENT